MRASTSDCSECGYRIGDRVSVAGEHGSVIDADLDRGWLEVDFDGVGQQWIEIAYAQPAIGRQ